MTNFQQAIIFDMDGVLLDSEQHSFRSWQAALADFGIEYTEAHFLEVVGCNADSTHNTLRSQFDLKPDDCQQIRSQREQILHDMIIHEGIPLKPGVIEVLERFAHVPKAVATSTSRLLATQKLNNTQLLQRFDAIVCGDEITHSKPHPEIYLTAAKAVAIEPVQCIAIEDSHAGIESAAKAGMKTILIPDMQPVTESAQRFARFVLNNMIEALPVIERHFNE